MCETIKSPETQIPTKPFGEDFPWGKALHIRPLCVWISQLTITPLWTYPYLTVSWKLLALTWIKITLYEDETYDNNKIRYWYRKHRKDLLSGYTVPRYLEGKFKFWVVGKLDFEQEAQLGKGTQSLSLVLWRGEDQHWKIVKKCR